MAQSEEFRKLHAEGLVDGLVKHENLLTVDRNHFYNILMANNLVMDLQSFYFPINAPNNKPQEFDNNVFLSIDGLILNTAARDAAYGRLNNTQSKTEVPKKKSFGPKLEPCCMWYLLKPDNESEYTPEANIDGAYSTKEVLDNLIQQKPIIELMMAPPAMPFTLLGRFYAYNCDAPDGRATFYTRPVLVKPGIDATSDRLIYSWENSQIKREKESKFLSRSLF